MTCDEDMVLFAIFLLDRFAAGCAPGEKSLLNCVTDWRREAFGPSPAQRERNLEILAEAKRRRQTPEVSELPEESVADGYSEMPQVAV